MGRLACNELSGRRFGLEVSDPWEFVTDHGVGPFRGTLLDWDGDCATARLDDPMRWDGGSWDYVGIMPSHEGTSLESLLDGDVSMPVGVIGLEEDSITEGDAFDGMRSRKGGLALIGAVYPLARDARNVRWCCDWMRELVVLGEARGIGAMVRDAGEQPFLALVFRSISPGDRIRGVLPTYEGPFSVESMLALQHCPSCGTSIARHYRKAWDRLRELTGRFQW